MSASLRDPVGDAPSAPRMRVLAGGLGALALALVLVLAPLQEVTAAPLLGDAGPAVRWAVPVVRVLADLAAALCLGALVMVLLVPAEDRPYRPALQWAGGAAVAWAAAEVVLLVLLVARAGGVAPGGSRFWVVLGSVVSGTALGVGGVVTLFGAAATAVLVGSGRRPPTTGLRLRVPLAAGAAVVAALAGASAGHAAHGDQAVMVQRGLHVLSAGAWAGGLAVLVFLGPRLWRDRLAVVTVRAYSVMAGWCYAVVVVSGVATAYAVLSSTDVAALTQSPDGVRYLRLLAVKAVALVILGGFGAWHRRHHLSALDRQGMSALWRLAAVELAVMVAVVAVAAVLADTAPPVDPSAVH